MCLVDGILEVERDLVKFNACKASGLLMLTRESTLRQKNRGI